MEVNTIFLNNDLAEEIYPEQPDLLVFEGQKYIVCKLLKSIYDLKQFLGKHTCFHYLVL